MPSRCPAPEEHYGGVDRVLEEVHRARRLQWQRQPRQVVADVAQEATQDRPLRRQPTAAGVRQREPNLARVLHQDGAQRPAAVQLYRDGWSGANLKCCGI